MRELNCKNCGAPIDPHRLKCEYCGTQYNIDVLEKTIRVESYIPDVQVVMSKVTFCDERLSVPDKAEYMAYIKRAVCANLVKQLEPYIDVAIERNPRDLTATMMGRLRVISPGFKF